MVRLFYYNAQLPVHYACKLIAWGMGDIQTNSCTVYSCVTTQEKEKEKREKKKGALTLLTADLACSSCRLAPLHQTADIVL